MNQTFEHAPMGPSSTRNMNPDNRPIKQAPPQIPWVSQTPQAGTEERLQKLRATLGSLVEEKKNMINQIKQNPNNGELKFELDIVNNNIETVQQKIDKIMA